MRDCPGCLVLDLRYCAGSHIVLARRDEIDSILSPVVRVSGAERFKDSGPFIVVGRTQQLNGDMRKWVVVAVLNPPGDSARRRHPDNKIPDRLVCRQLDWRSLAIQQALPVLLPHIPVAGKGQTVLSRAEASEHKPSILCRRTRRSLISVSLREQKDTNSAFHRLICAHAHNHAFNGALTPLFRPALWRRRLKEKRNNEKSPRHRALPARMACKSMLSSADSARWTGFPRSSNCANTSGSK